MHERDILLAALEKTRREEREAYLAEACGTDAELRSRVDDLLRASEVQDSFLERPAMETEVFNQKTNAVRQRDAEADELSLDFLQPSQSPQAIGRLGTYEVLEVIGRGGMGVVLKARDTKLNRVVAIKVLAPELASNPTARKRFQREAHAAAAVVHQHIVTIHAVDEDRVPYLVMECIVGQSLKEKIDREGHLPLVEILRIGQQVASGLAAAHAHGLIHRDVKPANILLENGVERVRITDFGLARAVDDVAITRTGEVAGTPQYMSPEQAQGLPIDARSDLFSLGCVLYAMCTGRPPFRAETAFATARRVCEDTPRPIREVNPEIPQWLTDIIERLLQKDPAQRFQSAKEVAELLGQYLGHVQHPSIVPLPGKEPVSPKRQPGTRRSRWPLALTAPALVLALALGLTEASGVTKVVPTVIRIVRGEGTLVIEVADPTVQVSLDGEELSIRGAGLQELRLLPGTYRLHATKDGQPVKDEVVTITRDGRKVVTVTREGARGSGSAADELFKRADTDGWVSLFNGKDLTGWKTLPNQPGNWRVENGVLIGSGPGALSHLYTEQGDFEDFHLRVEAKINLPGNSGVYFRASPPPITGFPAGYEAQICIEKQAVNDKPELHKTGSLFGLVRQNQVPRGAGPDEWFTMEVLAQGPHISIQVNGVITVNEFEDPRFRYRKGHLVLQQGSAETVVCFKKVEIKALSSEGKGAFVHPAEETVRNLTLLEKLDWHTDVVRAVASLPDGRRLLTVGNDKMVRIWDRANHSALESFQISGQGSLAAAEVSSDGRFVAVVHYGDSKAVARVWDLEKREVVCEFAPPRADNQWIRFSPDGTRLVTSGLWLPEAVLWDPTTGMELGRFDLGDARGVWRSAFSPNGGLLALGGAGRVRLFDVETRDVVADVPLADPWNVWDLEFAPGGKTLATGQGGGHVSLIDIDSRRVMKTLRSTSPVHSVRFLGNDLFLLACSSDATLRVWDLKSEKVVAQAATGNGLNHGLFISPDGRQVITAGGKQWDDASRSLKDHGNYALRLWELPESVWPKKATEQTQPQEPANQATQSDP